MRRLVAACVLVAFAGILGSGGAETGGAPVAPDPAHTGSTTGGDPVLVGAGDITRCDDAGDEAMAGLLDGIPGTVFAAGDNAYEASTVQEYRDCYDPSWGRHKAHPPGAWQPRVHLGPHPVLRLLRRERRF